MNKKNLKKFAQFATNHLHGGKMGKELEGSQILQ